jgi:multisubunit Na+/H+ antiporter MnhB subunit
MERETFVEAAVSVTAVALFLVAIVAVGLLYPDLEGTGGFALVGSIVFFVVVMVGAGYWLSRR